jgi:hypothetical protein
MRGRPVLILALLLAPALAGCFETTEALHVALHVGAGETKTLAGAVGYDGSIVVDAGGTLVLDHADVRLAQSLLVQGGRLDATESRIVFDRAGYERHDLEVAGLVSLDNTTLEGVREVIVTGGVLSLRGGSVGEGGVLVHAGALASLGTAWSVGPGHTVGDPFFGSGVLPAFLVEGGSALVTNGTLSLTQPASGLLALAGSLTLANLTLNGALAQDDAARVASGASLEMDNVALLPPDATRAGTLEIEGDARLVDTPLPHLARPPLVQGGGALTVAWTVTATAVSLPGNLPVGGLDLTLYSGQAPGAPAGNATTDANGQARLVAVEYVLSESGPRSGNPHAIVADGGGKRGASGAFVVEAPQSVTVPVVG